MNNIVIQSNDIQPFALTPPFIPLMTGVIDNTARYGLSIANYYKDPTGLLVTFGPYLNQVKNEKISLWLNGGRTPVTSELTQGESDTVELRLPPQLLKDGHNQLKCTVDRSSGNEETSQVLILLFSTLAPGSNDPDSGPGHSLLSIDVQPTSIDAAQAALGVVITMDYPRKKLHDFIEVDCNSVIVEYDLKPTPQNPAPDPAAPIELTIYTDIFKQAGDHPQFPIKYRVTDQLGNISGTDEVGTTPNPLDRWSAPVLVDVHLNRKSLPMPVLRERQGDDQDDPKTIDFGKLGGNPLQVLVHQVEGVWAVGDSIHLSYTAKLNGVVVATHDETRQVNQIPGYPNLNVPNSKIIADSTVEVIYEQLRSGKVLGISRAAVAQVVGNRGPLLSENFDSVPSKIIYPGQSIDTPSMTVTLVSGPSPLGILSAQEIARLPSGSFHHAIPGKREGQMLLVGWASNFIGKNLARLQLKSAYSKVGFWFSFGEAGITTFSCYNAMGGQLLTTTLPKSVGPYYFEVTRPGIARLEFHVEAFEWFLLDHFMFTL